MATAIKSNQQNKSTLPQLSVEQQGALYRAKQYAMQENVKHVLKKQQMQAGLLSGISPSAESGQNQAMQLQRQQALVLMCRVYVGSIFYDLREEIVRHSFAAFGLLKSINMSFDPITGKHKGFAFIEYETPDAAQMAMEQMGGVLLGGRPIRVGRPSNMPQSHPIIDQILKESETSKRIYVSSVHEDLSVDDVKSVFSAFGNITYCALAPDPTTGKHKGYGSIEYDSLQSAKDAISSMNLFDLGGQNLRVGRGIGPLPPTLQENNLASNLIGVPSTVEVKSPLNLKLGSFSSPSAEMIQVLPQLMQPPPPVPVVLPNIKNTIVPTVDQCATTNLVSPPAVVTIPVTKLLCSHIVKLCNMVDADEIDKDLEKEVAEECGKFGAVEKVVIYKEKQGEAEHDPCIVKIFVKFENVSSSKNSVEMLSGRWFGGRQIQASLYSEDKFSNGDYSG